MSAYFLFSNEIRDKVRINANNCAVLAASTVVKLLLSMALCDRCFLLFDKRPSVVTGEE